MIKSKFDFDNNNNIIPSNQRHTTHHNTPPTPQKNTYHNVYFCTKWRVGHQENL